jgi:hypothetical protein
MSVNVLGGAPEKGGIWVPGTSSAGIQGEYYGWNESTTNVGISASSASNNRTDQIVAQVKDAFYAGAESLFTLSYVAGTAEAGVTKENHKGAGALPASSLLLAYVFVEASVASITNAAITNVVAQATPGVTGASYREGTARPAAAVKGRVYYATDTKTFSVDSGSAWLPISRVATYGATAEGISGTGLLITESRTHVWVGCSAVLTEINVGGVQLNIEGSPHNASFIVDVGQEFAVKTTGGVNYKYNLKLF